MLIELNKLKTIDKENADKIKTITNILKEKEEIYNNTTSNELINTFTNLDKE